MNIFSFGSKLETLSALFVAVQALHDFDSHTLREREREVSDNNGQRGPEADVYF